MSDALDTGDRQFVVFLDSLAPEDLDKMPFVRDHLYHGDMDAGVPFVTPKVLGEIYTGLNPAENGMPAVSRFDTESRIRPDALTVPELAAHSDEFDRVCNFGLPFILPPEVVDENYWHHSMAMGNVSTSPREAEPHLHVPGPAGDVAAINHPDKEEDPDVIFDLSLDFTQTVFGQARSVAEIQDFDLVFISYRLLDSYCHYNYCGQPDDRDDDHTYRDLLCMAVDEEIRNLTARGDVFVFSDHGAREMSGGVFRINQWLQEAGYLSVTVDDDWIDKAIDFGVAGDDDVDSFAEMETVGVDQPGVTVHEDKSVAICADPFSTGLTVLDGANEAKVEDLIRHLEATEYIDAVHITSGKWVGKHQDECPDLYPERAPGVFVSGNLHPDMGGPEITRDGVHSRTGVFGATTDLDAPDAVDPLGLHDVLMDWLGLDRDDIEADAGAAGADSGVLDTDDEAAVRENLEDLGYL